MGVSLLSELAVKLVRFLNLDPINGGRVVRVLLVLVHRLVLELQSVDHQLGVCEVSPMVESKLEE